MLFSYVAYCFDTSNLNKTNPYYSEKNKKVNKKLKCENADNMIGKFIGLKRKNYAFLGVVSDPGSVVP